MKLFYLIFTLCTMLLIDYAAHAQFATRSVKSSTTLAEHFHSPNLYYGSSQLSNELNQIIRDMNLNAQISVFVKSMRYGDAIYAHNINRPLSPASTLKLYTAEAGLIFLGSDYRFSTQLLTDAKSIKAGILQGNLYIVLSGDPTLTYFDLIDLVFTLRHHDINAISGNVYIDNTAYDQRFYGPGWDGKDKGYCYAAPISASIINHNCLSFRVGPGKKSGGAAQVMTSPRYFYPSIKNLAITKAAHARSCSLRLGGDSAITLDGCLPKGTFAGLSYVVANIPEYNRALFKNIFAKLGIAVLGNVTFGSAGENLSLITQHASEPLKTLVNELLKKSDNIIAGAVFKKIGQLYTRTPGSWENGSWAVAQILAKNAKLNTAGLRILDGSGLSPYNLTTAAQMMQVLDFAFHHGDTSYEFISALPIAGVDGTLKHRMTNITRKVRAKTGTMSGIVSLAGYVINADKEPLAFVIIINGNKSQGWMFKALEDQIVTALTRYSR